MFYKLRNVQVLARLPLSIPFFVHHQHLACVFLDSVNGRAIVSINRSHRYGRVWFVK